MTRAPPPAFPRNPRGRLGFPALKGETVPDSLPATPKSPPTRRVPPRQMVTAAMKLKNAASLVAQRLKCLPPMRETRVQSLGRKGSQASCGVWIEDSREERSPWLPLETRPDSPGSDRLGACWDPGKSYLPFEFQGRAGDCPRVTADPYQDGRGVWSHEERPKLTFWPTRIQTG